jgi:hypothetical protein
MLVCELCAVHVLSFVLMDSINSVGEGAGWKALKISRLHPLVFLKPFPGVF